MNYRSTLVLNRTRHPAVLAGDSKQVVNIPGKIDKVTRKIRTGREK
jgi:hypothetical protein